MILMLHFKQSKFVPETQILNDWFAGENEEDRQKSKVKFLKSVGDENDASSAVLRSLRSAFASEDIGAGMFAILLNDPLQIQSTGDQPRTQSTCGLSTTSCLQEFDRFLMSF